MRLLLGAVIGIARKSLLLICFNVATVLLLSAQTPENHGDLDAYKFRTTLSWWYSQPSGHFSGKNNTGEFDLARDFHFGDYSTFTGTLDWRFKRKHHLLFSASPVSYSNSVTLIRTITFQGQTYNVGTRATSDINSFSFAPGYQWDFIRRNRGYLALATQFYLLDTKATLTGTVAVNGQATTRTTSGSFLAPLPVIGPHGRWYPINSDRLSLEGALNGMYFFGYGDFYSARGIIGVGITHRWQAIAGYQMGTHLSIHGTSSNIGIRLTQKGPVVGIEGSF
jgi:hypothetical protein